MCFPFFIFVTPGKMNLQGVMVYLVKRKINYLKRRDERKKIIHLNKHLVSPSLNILPFPTHQILPTNIVIKASRVGSSVIELRDAEQVQT